MKRVLEPLGIFAGLLCALAIPLRAQELSGEKAVDAGREALRESARYPWYDSEQDGLRDLHAKEKQAGDTQTRKTGWEWELPDFQTPKSTFRPWQFPTLATILQYAAIGLLSALVITLVVLLIRYFLKEEDEETVIPVSEVQARQRAAEIDRVEQLPFQVRRPDADLLTETTRLYQEGRYNEAIVYLFSYELVQLDKHQRIHLAKGKTNRQYLRELRHDPALRSILHRTMIAFEDVFFGRHELERERFEACWNRLEEFHQALEQEVMA